MGEPKCGMCGSDDMSNWTPRHTRSCSSCGHDPGNDKCTCGCSGMASDSKKASNDRAFLTGWSVVKQGLNPMQEAAEQAKQNPPDDPHAGLPEELRPDNPWNKAAIRRKEEADAYKVWNDSFKRRGA